MGVPFSFRRRLLLYALFLMVVLIGFLLTFYQLGKNSVLETVSRNSDLFAQQVEGHLRLRQSELGRQARMIRDNTQLREYMFIVVSIGTDVEPLKNLFNRQFGWINIDQMALVSREKKVLVNRGEGDLLEPIMKSGKLAPHVHQQFYYSQGADLYMVSSAPVYYREQFLGNVILATRLDRELIQSSLDAHYGQILLVQEGKVLRSTLPSLEGQSFAPANEQARLGGQDYRLHRIALDAPGEDLPEIWFALSDTDLLGKINSTQAMMLGLAVVAMLVVLLAGFLTIRDFSRPIGRLVSLMERVGEGELPPVRDTQAGDEIGYLTSKFYEMISRLKAQQEEIERAQRKLEEQATTDELTGFYNRRFLYDLYPKLWSEANRQRKTLGIILADLDYFKDINDKHGHLAGDEVLKQFTNIVMQCSRVSDFLVRMGGEEFLILTSEGIEAAQVLAEKIRHRVEATPMHFDDQITHLTCSFGVAQAEYSDGKDGLSAVLARADQALYKAKSRGRNCVATWDQDLKRA